MRRIPALRPLSSSVTLTAIVLGVWSTVRNLAAIARRPPALR